MAIHSQNSIGVKRLQKQVNDMKILFNFIPIKNGGGQQVATSFINVLKDQTFFNSCTFIAVKGTELQKLLSKHQAPHLILLENNNYSRFIFERFKLKKLIKSNNLDIVFTMFGPDLLKSGIPSVVGCAYSNLFFPEIDFWKDYNFYRRVLFNLIDKFRIKRTLQADGIIFENSSMMKRSLELYNYPVNQSIFIKPSISKKSIVDSFTKEIESVCERFPRHFKVLLLSTWQKNKNMHQIPFILKELYDRSVFEVSFIMTVSKDDPLSIELLDVAKKLGVEKNIVMIGSVKPSDVPYLYRNIDVVLLMSTLESFSNNIIESWTFEKPLIVSHFEWAKAICNEAAIYVNPFDPNNVAEAIIKLMNNEHICSEMIQRGLKEIETYPSPEAKVSDQLKFIELIYNRF